MANWTARTFLVASALAPLIVGVAGCHSGPPTVNKSDVQNQISAKMTDAAGNKPDTVTCPSDLTATVGAKLDCEMKIKGKPFGVNVTVTSVDNGQAKFDMVETVDKAEVATSINDNLVQQGLKPDSVSCPDNLKGVAGATLRCELKSEGQIYGVTVTVDSVTGGDVSYGFKVDDQPK
jgi:hypothetical protein